MRTLTLALFTAALCGVAACSVVPPYHAPETAVPAHFVGDAGWQVAQPDSKALPQTWWTVFGDPVLNTLEAQLLSANQSIVKAVTQVEQARAIASYQSAAFFPTVSANVSTVPYKTSANVVHKALAGDTIPDHTVGLSASWEPDLFGKVRAAATNARAAAEASEADLAAVRLSMTGDFAVDYFNYRSLNSQKRLLDQTVQAYQQSWSILQHQLQDGAIDASAVALAKTQLETARTQDTDTQAQIDRLKHAMATLLGVPASGFDVPAPSSDAHLPAIPAMLPATLLQRRPDIAGAERRVAAANAQIGIARAAFYPDLQLSATAGLESTFLSPWMTAPSLFWSIGPQLAGILFDGGARSALLKNAKAGYSGVVADYRSTVLAAFQEVEDRLSDQNAYQAEQGSQDQASAAASLALKLTLNRYNAGAVSYLDVVTAQTLALQAQQTDLQIAALRYTTSVGLIKAIGGGWEARDLADN